MHSFTTQTIGTKMRELRKAQRMSLSELARRVGLSRQALDSIERSTSYPKPDNLVVIFFVLGYVVTPEVRLKENSQAYEVIYHVEGLGE